MGSQSYTTAGAYTWTCPTGVTSVTVQCWGGGGAGGRSGGQNQGGGGGGAYATSTITVTPGNDYTVTVGAGGTDSNVTQNNGGDSWFSSNTTVMAKGGTTCFNSFTGATGGQASASYGSTKYSGGSGGNGYNGSYEGGGGGGSSAGTASNGNNGSSGIYLLGPGSGGAAVTGGGAGGDGGEWSNTGGTTAEFGYSPGGAGGGAGCTITSGYNNGGHGADGKVILTWTDITTPTVTITGYGQYSDSIEYVYGNVTADGGASVTAKGCVWNTSGSPTISSYTGITNDGSGTGSFTSTLTSLNPGTTYYVRAYATNSVGTAYSSESSFATTLNATVSISSPCTSSGSVTSGHNVLVENSTTINLPLVSAGTSLLQNAYILASSILETDILQASAHITTEFFTGSFTLVNNYSLSASSEVITPYITKTNGLVTVSLDTLNANARCNYVNFPDRVIDGFFVYIHKSETNAPYEFGTDPTNEHVHILPADKREFKLPGVPSDKFYHLGVQAYRIVDDDIDSSGILKSDIIQYPISTNAGHQPNTVPDFKGYIDGTSASTVADATDALYDATSGTNKGIFKPASTDNTKIPYSWSGLYVDSTNLGYVTRAASPALPVWKTYMDKDGKFYLSGAGSDQLSWNGSTLTIVGNITVTNESDFADSDADNTTTVIGAGTITTTKLELTGTNSYIKAGKTGPTNDANAGFWLGNDGGIYKFSIGNGATKGIWWDGNTLTVKGDISGSSGTIGGVTLNSSGITSSYFSANASGASFSGSIQGASISSMGSCNFGTNVTIGGKLTVNNDILVNDSDLHGMLLFSGATAPYVGIIYDQDFGTYGSLVLGNLKSGGVTTIQAGGYNAFPIAPYIMLSDDSESIGLTASTISLNGTITTNSSTLVTNLNANYLEGKRIKYGTTGTISQAASGGTTISHGCGTTPSAVIVSPSNSWYCVSASGYNSTTFTYGFRTTDGSSTRGDFTISWIAIY